MLGYTILVFLLVLFLWVLMDECTKIGEQFIKELEAPQLPHVYYQTVKVPITRLPKEGLVYAREYSEALYMPEIDHRVWGVVLYDRELPQEDMRQFWLVRKPREDV